MGYTNKIWAIDWLISDEKYKDPCYVVFRFGPQSRHEQGMKGT